MHSVSLPDTSAQGPECIITKNRKQEKERRMVGWNMTAGFFYKKASCLKNDEKECNVGRGNAYGGCGHGAAGISVCG